MMMSTSTLVELADQFCVASGGMRETTLSHRMFGDSKKLAALRGSADITVGRFISAMMWMAAHWPKGHPLPEALHLYAAEATTDALPKTAKNNPPEEDAA